MTTKRQYLAIVHTYGICCDEDGAYIGEIYVFGSTKERDDFVDDGPDYRSSRGFRQAITRREAMRTADAIYWQH